jgi:hypothetical protein
MLMIGPGARVHARSAFGEQLERRALTGVMQGADIKVVWVCKEDEWQIAQAEGRAPDGVPWPARDVRLAAG